MLHREKLSFIKVDDNKLPILFFFNYNLSAEELRQFISKFAENNDNVDIEKKYDSIELCLSMHSSSKYELKVFLKMKEGEQDMFKIIPQTSMVEELMEVVEHTDTEVAHDAFQLYLYIKLIYGRKKYEK